MTAVEYGGSFFKALAAAGLKADPSNRDRLFRTWPELSATYGPASNLHRALRDDYKR
jgi:hypothetical protein